MTELTLQTPMTVDELLALPAFKNYELVDGVLRERKRMGAEASAVAANILHLLATHVKASNLGVVFESEATYQCFGTDRTGRRPDVSFIKRERLPDGKPPVGAITVPADLAVEVISPGDRAYDVAAKVQAYRSAGFRLVWLVSPASRQVEIHRPDGTLRLLREQDVISGEDVLPGFECPVAEFFRI